MAVPRCRYHAAARPFRREGRHRPARHVAPGGGGGRDGGLLGAAAGGSLSLEE